MEFMPSSTAMESKGANLDDEGSKSDFRAVGREIWYEGSKRDSIISLHGPTKDSGVTFPRSFPAQR
jgi:hypothetical protein